MKRYLLCLLLPLAMQAQAQEPSVEEAIKAKCAGHNCYVVTEEEIAALIAKVAEQAAKETKDNIDSYGRCRAGYKAGS